MAEPRHSTGRVAFAEAIFALATALSFDLDEAVIGVYWHALKDVPDGLRADVLMEAGNRKWFKFPKPAELKTLAAEIVASRRDAAYRASLPATCGTCGHGKAHTGARWKEVTVNGVTRLTTCDCRTAALQAADRVGQAIALPASREDAMEIGQ